MALAALVALIVMGGCAASGGNSVEGPVAVYVSLPLTGPRGADGTDAADGARLALEQAGDKAGTLEVRAEFLDDANGKEWDPIAVGANARRAAQESSTAAYIGELDSEPTRASVPITNQAGIVSVSPGAGGIDLTGPADGYPDSPDRYRPSGNPTFARVVPDDAALASAAAEVATELGLPSVSVATDGSPFGELMDSEFALAAAEVGVETVGGRRDAGATLEVGDEEGVRLVADREYLIAAPLDPSNLPGRNFVVDFEASLGRSPGPYAAYGYEAMALILAAIEDAGDRPDDFRGSVVDSVLDAERPDSILGRYAITEEGDSTLCAVQPYALERGAQIPGKPICPPG